MYALVIALHLMTGDVKYLNSTYYNTDYTCNKVKGLIIPELNKDPEIFEAVGNCFKIQSEVEVPHKKDSI